MIQVLEFIFQDFWHWLGLLVLLVVSLNGMAEIIRAILHRNKS